MGGEFLLGGLNEADPHSLGVALPFQDGVALPNQSLDGVMTAVARRGRFENEKKLRSMLKAVRMRRLATQNRWRKGG